jgi:hypothetical protein
VDAWVASAICTAFPAARIWDPTQAMKGRNWDRAAALLGEGRVFLFEDKGTTPVTRKRKAPLQTHRIDIDRAQLDWYCDEVEPAEDVPVYYVLPKPPWKGSASSGHVPEQVASRVTSPEGPFEHWAYVIRCADLRDGLKARRSVDTHELPLPGAIKLADFFEDIRRGKAARWLSPDEADLAYSAGRLRSRKPPERRDLHEGSAFAVFVPAENLSI